MKQQRMTNWIGMICAAAVLFGFAQTAAAGGTAPGTLISNTATIKYSVAGNLQSDVPSATSDFYVDRKIDLTVAPLGAFSLSPGQNGAVYVFTVTNNGNDIQDYQFEFDAGGANLTDDAVFVDSALYDGAVPATSTWDSASESSAIIDNLGPDQTKCVYVVATVPLGLTNGATFPISLRARSADINGVLIADDHSDDANTSGTGPTDIQIVFADAAGAALSDALYDGAHSAQGTFTVSSAVLSVTKTATVISDPTSGANPKAIPGAVVEYVITVSNDAAATASATSIIIEDDLSSLTQVAFNPDAYEAGKGLKFTAPDGTESFLTNIDDPLTDTGKCIANKVTLDSFPLAPGESASVSFQVVIQ